MGLPGESSLTGAALFAVPEIGVSAYRAIGGIGPTMGVCMFEQASVLWSLFLMWEQGSPCTLPLLLVKSSPASNRGNCIHNKEGPL